MELRGVREKQDKMEEGLGEVRAELESMKEECARRHKLFSDAVGGTGGSNIGNVGIVEDERRESAECS